MECVSYPIDIKHVSMYTLRLMGFTGFTNALTEQYLFTSTGVIILYNLSDTLEELQDQSCSIYAWNVYSPVNDK